MTDAERAEKVARELVRVEPQEHSRWYRVLCMGQPLETASPRHYAEAFAEVMRTWAADIITAALAEARAEQRERDADIATLHSCDTPWYVGCDCKYAIASEIRKDAEREVKP